MKTNKKIELAKNYIARAIEELRKCPDKDGEIDSIIIELENIQLLRL